MGYATHVTVLGKKDITATTFYPNVLNVLYVMAKEGYKNKCKN